MPQAWDQPAALGWREVEPWNCVPWPTAAAIGWMVATRCSVEQAAGVDSRDNKACPRPCCPPEPRTDRADDPPTAWLPTPSARLFGICVERRQGPRLARRVRRPLKPVQRRILYAMQRLGAGLGRSQPHRTTQAGQERACRGGDVLGRFHPHGDQAAYDALVAHGAGLHTALPLNRWPGQLRQPRRRWGGGHALYRGAPEPHQHPAAG
jgi:hypothetical protein